MILQSERVYVSLEFCHDHFHAGIMTHAEVISVHCTPPQAFTHNLSYHQVGGNPPSSRFPGRTSIIFGAQIFGVQGNREKADGDMQGMYLMLADSLPKEPMSAVLAARRERKRHDRPSLHPFGYCFNLQSLPTICGAACRAVESAVNVNHR